MANIDFADTTADMGGKFGECMGDINYTVKQASISCGKLGGGFRESGEPGRK